MLDVGQHCNNDNVIHVNRISEVRCIPDVDLMTIRIAMSIMSTMYSRKKAHDVDKMSTQ